MQTTHPEASTSQALDVSTLELKDGTVLVEASAGTGKTHNIAELAVRALAEGYCTIDQVLLVTFTVKATAELRSRVHSRLVERIHTLQEGAGGPEDQLTLRRLEAAVGDFDSATILTHHQFGQRLISHLGILVDHDPSSTTADSLDDLVREVSEDIYLSNFRDVAQPVGFETFFRFTRQAMRHSSLAVQATQDSGQARARLLLDARTEFERRKRLRQVHSYDDMGGRLHAALQDPDGARLIRKRLGSQYRLVMVDEFQDTDVQQWEILRTIFADQALLVLIGDPKQAIYRFRGADVHAYLMASRTTAKYTLDTNWRSCQGVLDGVHAVINGAHLGPGIGCAPAIGKAQPLLDGDEVVPPAQLRVLRLRGAQWYQLQQVAEDLAQHVVELLSQAPTTEVNGQRRRLNASDVAVLCRTSRNAETMTAALRRAGVPTVSSGDSTLFDGQAAEDWEVLLDTLLDVRNETIRRCSLTGLVGWDLVNLVEAGPGHLEELAHSIRELSQLWQQRGFATMCDALYSRFHLHERLLGIENGSNDLMHLVQLGERLQREAWSSKLGPEELRRWFLTQRQGREEATRRLGTDGAAVRVMTMHGAKGLGFPVVMLPDLWYLTAPEAKPDGSAPRVVHGPDDVPLLDVDPSTAASADPEEAEESLRLAYVAMTRARSALRLWWANTKETGRSSLHRLLMHDQPGSMPEQGRHLRDEVGAELLAQLAKPRFAALPHVAIEGVSPAPSAPLVALQAWGRPRKWTRSIDRSWRRTSYSGLTADLHELGHEQRVVTTVEADEPELLDVSGTLTPRPGEKQLSPMAGIAGGAEFGTLVHAILEHVDPQSPDLRSAIAEASVPWLRGFGADLDVDQLLDALVLVFDTPLGALTGGRLRDIPASHRLPELDFEMTMGGGSPGTVAQLAALFSDRNLLAADDPLADYGRVLAETPAADQVLNGFLNGSIDAVLRVPEPGGSERFVVVDYKTNTMPLAPGEELTVQHYHAPAMAEAMKLAHYPLQALLYSVALHRFLSWRLPDYDPRRHLGGVGYLFVRGMAGAGTPTLGGMPAGVFTWLPGAEFVLAADDVMGGR